MAALVASLGGVSSSAAAALVAHGAAASASIAQRARIGAQLGGSLASMAHGISGAQSSAAAAINGGIGGGGGGALAAALALSGVA